MTEIRRAARHRGTLLTGVLLLCLAALTPVAAPPAAPPVKDDAFLTAATTGILDIEGGECFDDPAYLPSAGEPVVLYKPCAEQADNQSYLFAHAEDGPWDRTGLVEFARAGCGAEFTRRWGDRATSGLDFYPVLPTEETWADGDRDVMCVVHRPGGKLSGSVLPPSW
ncbi:hypothetical protein [Umezawaea beigongshangensis]|uniref:hypothetical protein n=1 Tax=Umezawaea beigongshangensis TaxID=2780383 RepID=UPI0018F189CC|nr:hypothetical protein [Umezawaea beigongshangensis]